MTNDNEHGLGLDLSTVSTGWFECYGDKLTGGRLIKRDDIFQMAAAVKMAIREAQPDWVAIEDIYIHPNAKFANPQTFKELAGLQFAVVELLHTIGTPYYLGHAASIDKACGIAPFLKRPQRKAATKRFAGMMGFEVSEDVADALAVLHWGMGERRLATLVEEATK